MGQIRIIHEHYDSKSWVSIIAGVMIATMAMTHPFMDKEITWAWVVDVALTSAPVLLLLVLQIIRRNKPVLVVYNDRIEARLPAISKGLNEMLYSDIKNIDFKSGQLLIWRDEVSAPLCLNLGANAQRAEETYNILRTTYDRYNREKNIKPVPVEDLPKKKSGLWFALLVLIITLVMMIVFICSEN